MKAPNPSDYRTIEEYTAAEEAWQATFETNDCSSEEVISKITPLIEKIQKIAASPGHKLSEQEAMGLLLAKYYGWNGYKILQATGFALEDSNYHSECQLIEYAISKLKK